VLKKFFGLFQPIKMEDAFFGPLLLMKATHPHLSYWEGGRKFEPLNQRAEVFIDTLSEKVGPSEAQRGFFRRIEEEYRLICLIIEDRFRTDPWVEHVMKGRFDEEFKLGSFSIPLCHQSNEEWSASFDSASDPEHILTVTFDGMEARNISVNG